MPGQSSPTPTALVPLRGVHAGRGGAYGQSTLSPVITRAAKIAEVGTVMPEGKHEGAVTPTDRKGTPETVEESATRAAKVGSSPRCLSSPQNPPSLVAGAPRPASTPSSEHTLSSVVFLSRLREIRPATITAPSSRELSSILCPLALPPLSPRSGAPTCVQKVFDVRGIPGGEMYKPIWDVLYRGVQRDTCRAPGTCKNGSYRIAHERAPSMPSNLA